MPGEQFLFTNEVMISKTLSKCIIHSEPIFYDNGVELKTKWELTFKVLMKLADCFKNLNFDVKYEIKCITHYI